MSRDDVNWSQFGYSQSSTISLSEYPFDMHSHWIPLREIKKNPDSGLIDLEESDWNHVKDHVINGEIIVPGATSLRILDQFQPGKALIGIDFLAPILPVSSKIQFTQKESNGSMILCADGLDAVTFDVKDEKNKGSTVVRMEMPRKAFKTKVYERFSLSALMYQKRFQVISTIGASSGKGVSDLENVDKVDILIDGALQSIAMGYLLEQPADHHPWLLFNIEKVQIVNPRPDGKAKAYFTYSNSGAFLNGDVSVCDRDGNLLVDIKNVCFRRKEIEGRASVPVVVAKPQPVIKTSEALRTKAKNYLLKWFDGSFGWNDFDEKADFFDLGLSSLQAVRLRNYLREEYLEASTTIIFDHPTILDLSNYLASLEVDLSEKEKEISKDEKIDSLLPSLPSSRLSQSPIGIRSASCRLPGGVEDPAEFWELLMTGKNVSSRTPASRIPSRNVLIKGQKYGASVEGGNFLSSSKTDVAAFDSTFFKISKSEAEMMDPQQRLLLECVEECIENSGDMDMTDVGVFVGLMEKEYVDLMEQQQTSILSMLGSMVAVIAGRVNYVFGSYGPSVTVDTACSSSLVAVEMAVNALLDGRCKRAIVAGVNLILSERGQGHRSNGKMLSAHGMSLSFDARASGYGRSDGCVVLLLERAKPTVKYMSILRGMNVNHGGRSVSLTAPNGIAHKILLNSLFQSSPGVQAAVWEAHGTGTSLGDPIEVNTLSSLLQNIVISSTKASLGHGEASAGTTGLLKLSLTLENDYVPALIHFHVLNKDIQPGSIRFPVVGEEKNFDIGGISSFGVSGTNAAVLAEKNPQVITPISPLYSIYLVPISAKNSNSLNQLKSKITDFIQNSEQSLADICGAIASRNQHSKRMALLVSRGRKIGSLERPTKLKPEFCLIGENLEFDLLAIEEIGKYFEYLDRFDLSDSNKLLLATVKFLKNVISSFKWLSTSPKSHVLSLLFSGSLEINENTVRLLEGNRIPERFQSKLEFVPEEPNSTTVTLGGRIKDLKSLLRTLGELFIGGVDLDWSAIYSTPSRFIQLPTYPFNRQVIWFTEKKYIFEHSLLGTEVNRAEKMVEFENQISPMRHPAIFKHGFGLGEALLSIFEAGRQGFDSSFQISNLTVRPIKPEQAVWLTTSLDPSSLHGRLGSTEVFSCTIEKTTSNSSYLKSSPIGKGRTLFYRDIPSSIVVEYDKMITIEAVYDCPYRALFHVLDKRGFGLENIQIKCFLPLEKKLILMEEDGLILVGTEETGCCLEISHTEEVKTPSLIKEIEEIIPIKKKQSSGGNESSMERIKAKLINALNDVLLEEIREEDKRGFMEMGMDSLTLVDFVNRLNEKYFPKLEISTTDIFDNSSVDEMVSHLKLILGTASSPVEIESESSDVKSKIIQALVDVLPEEPQDYSQGFMEMGMDSLTLVDFVNRLNEKYFLGREISTTDIFDHPSLDELTAHFIESSEETETSNKIEVKPVAELLLEKGKQEEIREKICRALTDVLPEEPQDFSQGFMEMGMDSLTLVDFVNRLNEKYFPQLEMSTTDIFDSPTVLELTMNIMEKIGMKPKEIQTSFDSGIGCSGEASPKKEEEILSDSFFFIEEESNPKADYRLVNQKGKLVILKEKEEIGLDKLRRLITGKQISIELEDEKLTPESLFLQLIEFCKELTNLKLTMKMHIPNILSSSQFMARAFMKTAAAERPENIQYKWTEQLQRKAISEGELQEKLTGIWLITGGLSGIGLSSARFLVEEGVEGVILISRRIPDETLRKELDEMRNKTKVVIISADIMDFNKMKEALKSTERIDGVIHCAGVLQDGKLERQNSVSFRKVFGPKGDGYDVLEKLLRELDYKPSSFIAMSSFTSACGNIGQLNYGVANAYLDSKMAERRKRGEAGTSIHWGNWLETGMAVNKNIHKILSDYGFIGFTTEEGLKYLKFAILVKPERFMAAKVDWNVVLEKRKDIRPDLIKEGLYFEQKKEEESFQVVESIRISEGSDDEDPVETIRNELLKMAQGLIKNKIKTNKNFMEMGFISHTLATLLEMIKERFKVKLAVAVFYEYTTLDDLAEYLAEMEKEIEEKQEERGSYCDVFALNVYYDNLKDFTEEIGRIKKGKIKSQGRFLQQIQGKSLGEITNQLSSIEYKELTVEKKGKLVMMFPGQGAQYPLMGAQLAESLPEFKRIFHDCLEKCDILLKGKISLLEIVNNSANYKDLLLTSSMQPIMFSFCYSLGHFWKYLGVKPDFYLGHSVGEIVAGVLGEIMSLDEGIQLIVARAKVMEKIKGRGAMLAINSRATEEVLKKFEVSLAAINSTKQLVIAGKKSILDQVLSFVKGKQLQATFVNAMYPFHSALIREEDLVDLRQVLKTIRFKQAVVPIVSNVNGNLMSTFCEEYLIKHTISTVQFVDCTETLVKEGVATWLEAGPSATLCQFLKRIVEPKDHLILQSIQDKGEDSSKFIETALELEKNGIPLNWERIYLDYTFSEDEKFVDFPSKKRIELSEEETAIAVDHKVNNQILIAGMHQVKIVLSECNRNSSDEDFFTLSGIRLPNPWKLETSRKAEIVRNYDNRVTLEVEGKTTCAASLKQRKMAWKQALLEESFMDCKINVDAQKWYSERAENTLQYGPNFQVLKETKRDERRAIAKGLVETDFIWPLMDGSLHLVCLIVKHRRFNEYYVPVTLKDIYLNHSFQLEKGQKVIFLAELIAENEKFIQFNTALLIEGKVVFEARNVTCVVFKTKEPKTTVALRLFEIEMFQEIKVGQNGFGEAQLKEEKELKREKKDTMIRDDFIMVEQDPSTKKNQKLTEEVIMVGSAGSFCFASVDLPSLWQQLQIGVCSHSYSKRDEKKRSAFLDQDIAEWDPEFFGISPKEARFIDPMQRLLMVFVYRALENAGFPSLPAASTGVYVGQSGIEFIQMIYKESHSEGHLAAGTHGSCLSGRISHWLKLEGPSLVVDTACSSSANALVLAAEAISQGTIQMAIVAGIHLILHDTVTQVLSNAGMLSECCKVFDAAADGYQRSEGIGVILLTSKKFADQNGLFQLAKVGNWFSGHNGRSAAMQVPNGNSEEFCMRMAGGNEEETEMHATGTPLGDPVESAAVLRIGSSNVSSIKSLLGHAEGASGMASILSSLLQLQFGYRIPQLHFCCPNPKISNFSTRIVGNEVLNDRIRVNNFGFSGSNVSLSIEKIPELEVEEQIRKFYLIPFSSKSRETLSAMRDQLLEVIEFSDLSLSTIAANYQSRPQYRHRGTILVDYCRQIVRAEGGETAANLPNYLVEFLYGHGVATLTGSLLNQIQTVLEEAGVVHLPKTIPTPFEFFKILEKEFVSGVTINWKAIDIHSQSRPITLPGYKFNNRAFWCLDSRRQEENSKIYFTKNLVEKPFGSKREAKIYTLSEGFSQFPMVSINQLEKLEETVLLFHPKESSYSEAVFLCKVWEKVEESQDLTITVVCKVNGSTYTEWTALLRSLAAEKLLKYSFISYEETRQLEEELNRLEEFEVVHYKNQRKFVERLERISPKFISNHKMKNLLISGGNGGIGEQIIKYLKPEKTTILSRSTGTDLSQPGLDIQSEADLVVHSAGIVDNALLERQTEEKFKNVGEIKVNGYKNLSKVSSKIILISSAAAIFGSFGQANYAFANGKMTSLAEISGGQIIHFGPWSEVGMLAGRKLEPIRNQIKNGGWNFLDPKVGVRAMDSTDSVIVFDGNFQKILEKNPHLGKFLERIMTRPKQISPSSKTVKELIEEVSGLRNLEEKEIPLMQLGLDSLMMEELRTKIGVHLGTKISSAELYDNCTLTLLESLIQGKKENKLKSLIKRDRSGTKIAIIGASGSFSGAGDIEEFWKNLMEGQESITREESIPGFVSAAGLAPDIDKFDFKFFKMTKEEADTLDPQIRIFIQHAYNSLASSGYIKERRSLRIGVFAGSEPSEYCGGEEESLGSLQKMFRNNMKDFVATMTAHALDLNGPAVGIFSACSTTLLAIQQGVNALRLGQIDLALVGAVSLVLPNQLEYEFQDGMVLSQKGECRPFDRTADGTIRGSAAGCFLLKMLSKAEEENNRVLSVIHGIGTSNDGGIKASFMAPNSRGQISCMEEALAGLSPEEKERIAYVECHGTGTLVGDEIELKSLWNVYQKPLILGSVKANIGHGFAGAGVAGIAKAMKMLDTGWIPPQINFENPIEMGEKFVFNVGRKRLEEGVLIAVSSFGIGGTNGHLILGKGSKRTEIKAPKISSILPISAKSKTSLEELKATLKSYIFKNPEQIGLIQSTLQYHREDFQHRTALIVKEGLISELKESLCREDLSSENVAFFFSPQGVQYSNMERELMNVEIAFSKKIQELCEMATRITGFDFLEVMYPREDEENPLISRSDLAQISVFIINMATVAQLSSWGIRSDQLIGHSVGEYSALVYAGVLSEKDCIRLLYIRGKLCHKTEAARMIAIRGEIPPLPEGVDVSAILSNDLHCIVGSSEQIQELEKLLAGREFRELKTERGFHSRMLDGILDEFEHEANSFLYKRPKKKIISGMDGTILSRISPSYLRNHLRKPVNLRDGLNSLLSDKKIKLIIEIGPSGVLRSLLRDKYPSIRCVNTIRNQKTKEISIWNTLAELWIHGYLVDWKKISTISGNDPHCPGYSFEKTDSWKEKLITNEHNFYSLSWIPIAGRTSSQFGSKILHISSSGEIETWKESVDGIVYSPKEGENHLYFTIKQIFSHAQRLQSKRLIVLSDGSPNHWISLGPIREFQLINSEPICQFVINPESLNSMEVARRIEEYTEDILMLTSKSCFRMGYSQIWDKDSTKIGGVVVIFGGTGTLGSAYRSVLKRMNSVKTVVIIGRRSATSDEYQQADVSDSEQVKAVLQKLIEKHGRIDVVINLAGKTTSNSLEKSEKDVEEVLSAKIKGTMNILSFFADNNLRLPLLVLSGSLSSYLSLQGNSDYAAANCFLDGLALNGHPFVDRIQTIQWPMWKDGRMARNTVSGVSSILKRGALSSAQGAKAIRESLSLSGCLAYSLIHPTQLRKLTTKAQLMNEIVTISPPKTDKLEIIKSVWKEVLSCEINEKSNFFVLGGNSLNALRLVWHLNNQLGIKITVNYVFSHPILEDFYQNLPVVGDTKETKRKMDALSKIPLSFAQENMLLLRAIDPGPQYNIVFVIEFGSKFDQSLMNKAIRSLISRQSGLRTLFKQEDGGFSQEILSLTESFHSLRIEEMLEEKFGEIQTNEKEFLFDFKKTPMRIRWIRTELGWRLLFNKHHILTDGWSMTVLAKEIQKCYQMAEKREDPKPAEKSMAAVAWNDREKNFEEELENLKKKFQDLETTKLVRDETGLQGFGRISKVIPEAIVERIKELAQRFKTTDFIVSLSCFLLTLRRWKQEADEDQIVVGIPISGRDELSEGLIGYCLNNIVLKLNVSLDSTIGDLIPLVEKEFLEARRTEHIPFHKLVATLGQERSKGQHPIFQMYFNFRHSLDFPRIEIKEGEELKINQISMNTLFDFSTTVDETPEGIRYLFEFNREYYFEETIEQFAEDFLRIVVYKRRKRFLKGKKLDIPRHLLFKLDGPSYLSKVEQEFLIELGIPIRSDSAVILEMSANNSTRIIPFILESGMAFAPIDPSWPETRKDSIKEGLHNSLCLKDEFLLLKVICSKRRNWKRLDPFDLAYIIHTSGSTGKPKGVGVTFRNLSTFLRSAVRQMLLNRLSKIYNSVNTVFDVSVSNILGAAVIGSEIVLHGDLKDQIVEATNCSYVFLTSAIFNSLSSNQIEQISKIEKLFVGGESIQEKNLQIALKNGLDLTQIYGPTEGTIWSLTNRCKIEKNSGKKIGQPMAGENGWIQGEGPLGELILEGDKVSRGYLHANIFFHGQYKTKDLVRMVGKDLFYLGRLDGQIKIRGNRIEILEVEAQVLKVTKSQNAVVLKDGERLIAFLVNPFDLNPTALLRELLPTYCIPSAFISVSAIPTNSSGKVDKLKLLQDFHDQLRKVPNSGSGEKRDIMTSIEEKMLEIFSKISNKEVLHLDENFFDLGGHSLLLLTLQQTIKDQFEIEIPVTQLFSKPTVAEVANLVVEFLKPSLSSTDTSIITKLREVPKPKFNVYLMHAVGGAIFPYYAFLQIFPKDISVYAIEYRLEYKAETLKELAALYAKTVAAHTKQIRPFILGHSMGGTISREMIPDMKMWGYEIPFVVMFDSWVLRPDQLKVENIRGFMETVFAPLPNAVIRVERAVKLATMLKSHKITRSQTKLYLFKSKELGVAAFREAVRPDLNEELSRSLVGNGFERVSFLPVSTWLINGDHESCLKVENLKTRQKEIMSIFQAFLQ